MSQETDNPVNVVPAAVGLADLLGLVRRQIKLIVFPAVLFTIFAAIALQGVAPRYSAEALLMIDSRTSNPVNMEMMIGGLGGDKAAVMGEIQMLTSTPLAEKVIDELQLDELPEFNKALRPPGMLKRLLPKGARAATASGAEVTRVRVVEIFLDRLRVEPRPDSRVVSVMFTSEDAQLARDVPNVLGELYLQAQLESKFDTLQRTTAWLNDRVATLRADVEESEQHVEEFREQSGLLEGGGTTLTDQEVSQLNTEVIAASTARVAAEVQLRQVRELMAREDGAESVGQVLDSPLIQRLREQQVVVLRQVAELSTKYGDKHPAMVTLRADAADLEAKIDTEIAKIVTGLESEFRIARGREQAARAALRAAKSRVGEDNKAMVTLRSLEREAQANRLLLESMMARFTEANALDDIASQRPDARIISQALVPTEPSYPMTKAVLALVFISGGFLGLMAAFARELMDFGFRSGEQLEAATGLLPLGFVPRINRRTLGGKSLVDYLLEEPISAYSESIRTIFATLVRTQKEQFSHSILITSCQPEEGKSTLAVSLARTIAKSGRRVLIIDADCRNPTVGKIMGIDRETGLTDVLRGGAELEDTIVQDEESGADVLCSGPAPGNPPAMFAAPSVDELLATLATQYEYIILDSPPTMAVSDAMILSGVIDSTILVARWGSTRRVSVSLAARQLKSAGAELMGAVLTMVDVKKHAMYGYGDSGAYTGDLTRYYHANQNRALQDQ